ncbi:hypothetical protein Ping_0848 [Psychromonas ingrahamii 37]|uniref:DUF3494 domain-containing protein n=1 Tax=Psychromonas ingrahamii (strain DSM 17664 / CCUG 51855 / 37) TaxID=357804 RepID=A1ST75_PSYIN|nr:ice-binding family protein [Psychromonas ingrahamii]ABM02690.1 hypothetical protein Ping_0848 [Psychromonas ingrahamii 37]
MKNILLKTCLTALALSVAGLANAQDAGEPVKIFKEQLTSHAAISAAAISISADSFVDGHIASQAAVTTGAGSVVQNIVSGAATGIGAAAKTCDIYAGAAIAVGAGSTVGILSAGGAVTLGALADRDVICDSAPAVVTSDFDAANAQIKSAQSALDTIPASSLVDAYTLVGSMDTGVYEGAAITIPANTLITFDANGEDGVWIFKLSGAMTVGAGSEFEIINAGDNNAVIWDIGGALTLGAGSTFLGTAFVEGAVSGATASVSCGNLYATGAISIGNIGSIGGDDCKVAADQLADFSIEEGEYSFIPQGKRISECPLWEKLDANYGGDAWKHYRDIIFKSPDLKLKEAPASTGYGGLATKYRFDSPTSYGQFLVITDAQYSIMNSIFLRHTDLSDGYTSNVARIKQDDMLKKDYDEAAAACRTDLHDIFINQTN